MADQTELSLSKLNDNESSRNGNELSLVSDRQMASTENFHQWLKESLCDLNERLDHTIEQKFITQRFETIENAVSEKLGSLTKRFETLENAVSEKLGLLKERFETLENAGSEKSGVLMATNKHHIGNGGEMVCALDSPQINFSDRKYILRRCDELERKMETMENREINTGSNNLKNNINEEQDGLHWKTFLQSFVNSSTLHGIQRITGKVWTRLFWSLLIMAAIGYAGWQFAILMTEYYKYPVFVDVRFHDGNLECPQITLCHISSYQRSKIFQHKAFQHLDAYSTASEIRDILYNLTEKERISLSYEASEIGYGEYFNTSTNVRDTWTPTLLHTLAYGNCYSFNPPKGLKFFFIHINLRLNDTVLNKRHPPGVFVILNQQGVYPYSLPQHFLNLLKPNNVKQIKLRLEIINLLNGSYGNCQDNEHMFQDRTGLEYNKHVCESECRIKNAIHKCGCVPVGSIYPSKFKIAEQYNIVPCPPSMLECGYEGLNTPLDSITCPCHTKCRTMRYALKTRQSSFNGYPEPAFDEICKGFNLSCKGSDAKQWAMSNVAVLSFAFQDQMYKEFTEKPLYTFSRFISDIGGTLGICIGASVLTLFEFVQLFLGIFPFIVRRYFARDRSVDV